MTVKTFLNLNEQKANEPPPVLAVVHSSVMEAVKGDQRGGAIGYRVGDNR